MKSLRLKLFLGIGIVTLLMSSIAPLAPLFTQHAQAATPYFSYLNMYQIVGDDETVWQTTSVDGKANRFIKIYPVGTSCPPEYLTYTKDNGKVDWKLHTVNQKTCKYEKAVDISEPAEAQNALKLYTWSITRDDTIRRFGWGDIGGGLFRRASDPLADSGLEIYTMGGANDCINRLIVPGLGDTADFYSMKKGQKFATYWNTDKKAVSYRSVERASTVAPKMTCISPLDQEGTGTQATVAISLPNFSIDKSKYAEVDPANGGTTINSLSDAQKAGLKNGGDPADPTDSGAAATCEGAIPVLGWIICAVTEIADNMMSIAENLVKDVLTISPQEYGEGSGGTKDNGLKTAWSAIRILSTVVLVGIALFMIIAQIFNFDFVSAYTVKKIVPKLVIAIIAMQLSWFLATTLIQVFNLLGHGIQELIYAPFGGPTQIDNITAILAKFYHSAGSGTQVAGTLGMAAVATGVLAGIGGGFGLLAAAIGVIIAVLIALVTLVIRKIILIVLLVLSPLAIVLWILPNTEKYWKQWWDMFIKLLIMFPMIMGLLAVGKVFAHLVANIKPSSGQVAFINFFVILIGYFGTLFLIPKTFSYAGKMFAQVNGAIGKAGGQLKNVGPVKRVEEAKQQNIKSREYNRHKSGLERAANGGNRFSRGWGRFQAGTAGARGDYAGVLRAQEREKTLKEAQLQAQMEYSEATKNQDFGDRMDESEAIAKAEVGSTAMLNGRQITVTKAMQDHAFSEVVGAKQGGHARRILSHYESQGTEEGILRANELKNSNVGGLMPQAPELYKGAGAFKDISVGAAAKMDNTSWEKMADRHKELAAQGAADTQHANHAEYESISHVASTAYNDSKYDEDMTGAKRQYAQKIIGTIPTTGATHTQGQPRQQAGTTQAQQVQPPPQPPRPEAGTYRDDQGNTRQQGGPGGGGVILG